MPLMKRLLNVLALSLLASCAQSRFVEPLDKGDLSVGAGLGGPGIEFGGAPIPIPITTIEVGYGIDTNFTVFGAWHTTAAFFGNIQFDAGVSYRLLEQKKYRPNLSCSPSLNFIYNPSSSEYRLWPILDVNSYWNYGKRRNYFYFGVNNYFEMRQKLANDQVQPYHWMVSPQIGHVIKGKERPWRFGFELKFLAPYLDNTYAFVPYTSIFGKWGSTGVYINFSYPISMKR